MMVRIEGGNNRHHLVNIQHSALQRFLTPLCCSVVNVPEPEESQCRAEEPWTSDGLATVTLSLRWLDFTAE